MFRKYGDRSDWKRIIQREYAQSYVESKDFTGYISLLNLLQVTEPLWVQYGEKKICIVDNAYTWLQHFPLGRNYSVTTMFDAMGEIVQWYIDICHEVGLENNIPWMDDLILDIVVLPSGEVFQLDEEELEEALESGSINQEMYDLAKHEAARITTCLKENQFNLLDLSKIHRKVLEGQLKKAENEHA
ncbi:DUF402 domain-containing protein [Psychrobacillus sp. NEAU-3TGS]|uniref:DUF402 domain-containing protein n=1 Tax=Psychrobacillus sp. NEAU-3TGS TaxID=2995412 RepID=UPI00249603BB|nr:DUF402 domain-containing protein [Psychrobacillus sp. NEAU-3TGS]MDI2588320.1 DUF402 domain-containing protein [Psychrobacillus sp. NEAU-3TGS]